MASFVPHYRKKQLQLRELEGELLSLLQKGAPQTAVLHAAEQVLQAQVRAFQEQIASLSPSEKNAPAITKLQCKIEQSQATTPATIIEEFRQRAARLKEPVAISRAPRRGCW